MTSLADAPLYNPARHAPLADMAWDGAAVRAEIAAIVEETRAAFRADALWPNHPEDEPGDAPPMKSLYMGAAGVIWALDYLASVGACAPGGSSGHVLPELLVANHEEMRPYGSRLDGLLLGDAGLLMAQWRFDRSEALADAIAHAIFSNTDNPTLELMWGAPGTMLTALSLYRATGQPRWADMFRDGAAALEQALAFDEAHDCWLWTQDLYGRQRKYLGAVHGFAGNAYALIEGLDLLAPGQQALWSRRIAQTLRATAIVRRPEANWPPTLDPPRAGVDHLVQHCHGAPGMITCLATLAEPIDDLLLAGGELTWKAGPLAKGANLCHGTAGNGYAFLKLFARTGDEQWLARARAFAMHAIAQSRTDLSKHGMRRFSLWTGDPGLAIYLWDCLQAQARFPTMDVF